MKCLKANFKPIELITDKKRIGINFQVNSEISVEKATEMCPICCMANFKSTEDLGAHIEDHFNQKGTFTSDSALEICYNFVHLLNLFKHSTYPCNALLICQIKFNLLKLHIFFSILIWI